MDISQLHEAAIQVANTVLGKKRDKSNIYEPCTKTEIEKIIETPGYYQMIKESILSVPRISTNRGAKRNGGLVRLHVENSQKELTSLEKETIKAKVFDLFEQSQKVRQRPEGAVEIAFYEWKKGQSDDSDNNSEILSIVSSGRKLKEWENVDLYEVRFEKSLYHISFKPILISYEVKPAFPDNAGYAKAKNYLKFSHESYLVFKDARNEDLVKQEFAKFGNNSSEGVGFYYTQDGIEFKFIGEKKRNLSVADSVVDSYLDKLLTPEDKKKLLDFRREYIRSHIIGAL